MTRTMLKSKTHRATITDSDLHYVGSITIDPDAFVPVPLLGDAPALLVVAARAGATRLLDNEWLVAPSDAAAGTPPA